VGDLLLAKQITTTAAGGDGGEPDCRSDRFTASPSASLTDGRKAVADASLLRPVGLCLTGFLSTQPVTVTVTAGSTTYTVSVALDDRALPELIDPYGHELLPETTLFDGVPMKATKLSGSSTYQSGPWRFVPSSAARDAVVLAGRITIRATQKNGGSSSLTQQVLTPGGPDQLLLDRNTSQKKALVVYGFKPGLRVPVGLYRGDTLGISGPLTLVRQISVLRMPASGIAVYEIPPALTKAYGGQGSYCLAAPVADLVLDCAL
jgi:hypothetical protein